MHSRIFQVSTMPIDEEDYTCESYYYDHWFLHQIADYVDEDCDRDDSIEWLDSCAKGYEICQDNNGNYRIIVVNKEEYFASAYEVFVEELKKLGTPTIEQFSTGLDLYRLKNAYDDKFGFYIDVYDQNGGHDIMTMNDFIRVCNVGTVYYIGGVIDYHC